jgi:GT2 family glycosyltransferase
MESLVSIIIVNHNGKLHLDKCLGSLKNTLYSNFEVLVVDNSSTDGSVDLVKQKYPAIKLIELKKNVGYASSNNLAAREAKGDFYIFLNNDTVVTKTWLSELVKSLTDNHNGKVAMAQSLLLRQDGEIDSSGDYIDRFGRPYSSKLKNPPQGRKILSARAACMITKKEIFWELSGFEDDFFASFEDVHLGWKAWISGYEVILASNSIVYHSAGQTVKNLTSTMNFHSMKNQLCIILLNFEFPLGIKNLLMLFPTYIRSIKIHEKRNLEIKEQREKVEAATYSNPILLRDIVKTFFWLCTHSPRLYKKYKVINKMRVNSTDSLIKIGLISRGRYEK